MNDTYYTYIYLDPLKPGKFEYGNYKFDFEPFYVGQGKNKRFLDHLNEAKYKTNINGNKHKFFRIRKILDNNESPIILKIKENISQEASKELEIFLISLIGCEYLNLGPLTNLTEGGELGTHMIGDKNCMYGLKGKNHPSSQWERTDEYWKHVAESLMGAKNPNYGKKWTGKQKKEHSEKVKSFYQNVSNERLQEIRYNTVTALRTPEHREKMSKMFSGEKNPRFGKKQTIITRNKIAKKAKESCRWSGKNNPTAKKWKVISPENVIYEIYGELHKFCKDNNIGSADALKLAGRFNRPVTRGRGKGWKAIEIF